VSNLLNNELLKNEELDVEAHKTRPANEEPKDDGEEDGEVEAHKTRPKTRPKYRP